MKFSTWLVATPALAVLAAYLMVPGPVGSSTGAGAPLQLADLDADGSPESIHLEPDGKGHLRVRLTASAGKFVHDVLAVKPAGPLHLVGSAPRWYFADEQGQNWLAVQLLPQPDATVPDLVVLGGGGGKRYRWVERGFMKLDAHTVVPGFAVGLLALGDLPEVVKALGGEPDETGHWSPPAPMHARMRLTFGDDGRVRAIAYDAPALVALNGVGPGATLAQLEKGFPGRREGEHWVSARYGVRADLDKAGHARTLKVSRPWPEVEKGRQKASR